MIGLRWKSAAKRSDMTTTRSYSGAENMPFSKVLGDTTDAKGAKLSKSRLVKRISALLVVLFAVSLPYFPLTKAYFVNYDDFAELNRTVFEDARQPSIMFTTKHDGAKYRPLNRAINLVFFRLGHGGPGIFRARNVFFHLLNVAVLFGLGTLLSDSIFIASVGAILFGLNPLAHQAVAGAIWTNTTAASMALISVALGIWSYRASRHELRWLIVAITIAWIGVFTYEADVTSLGIIVLYFVLDSLLLHRVRVRKSWVWALLLLSTAVVASMIGTRAMVLKGEHQPIAPLILIAKNSVMYVIALLLPVDSLLANQWFGTPLVSEIHLESISHKLVAIAGACAACFVALVIFALWRAIRKHGFSVSFMRCVFLLGAAVLSILPLLVFCDRPSETYLYLPVAYTMLALAYILAVLRRSHPALSYILIAFLISSYGCATWGRSQRVIHSAAIAQRILNGLPIADWKQGEWHIRLANAPGYTLPPRYGLYTYRGLDTIGNGDGVGAVRSALQLQTGNEYGLFANVLSADQMFQSCSPVTAVKDPCFWVYPDGRVEQFPGGPTPRSSATQ
jgi:hypothetical protein